MKLTANMVKALESATYRAANEGHKYSDADAVTTGWNMYGVDGRTLRAMVTRGLCRGDGGLTPKGVEMRTDRTERDAYTLNVVASQDSVGSQAPEHTGKWDAVLATTSSAGFTTVPEEITTRPAIIAVRTHGKRATVTFENVPDMLPVTMVNGSDLLLRVNEWAESQGFTGEVNGTFSWGLRGGNGSNSHWSAYVVRMDTMRVSVRALNPGDLIIGAEGFGPVKSHRETRDGFDNEMVYFENGDHDIFGYPQTLEIIRTAPYVVSAEINVAIPGLFMENGEPTTVPMGRDEYIITPGYSSEDDIPAMYSMRVYGKRVDAVSAANVRYVRQLNG